MHSVGRGHCQSRDKYGSHNTGSALSENPTVHANLMALSFIQLELWATELHIVKIGTLDVFGTCELDLDLMTFIYKLDWYCLEIYRMCKCELPTSRLSKVIV